MNTPVIRRDIDSRYLKNGKTRFRAKYSNHAMALIDRTINFCQERAPTKFYSHAFEIICMDYLAGITQSSPNKILTPKMGVYGNNRMLLQLYPDQLELVRVALDSARLEVYSDTEAIHHICSKFFRENIKTEDNKF